MLKSQLVSDSAKLKPQSSCPRAHGLSAPSVVPGLQNPLESWAPTLDTGVGAHTFVFPIRSQVRLVLLVLSPHLETPCPTPVVPQPEAELVIRATSPNHSQVILMEVTFGGNYTIRKLHRNSTQHGQNRALNTSLKIIRRQRQRTNHFEWAVVGTKDDFHAEGYELELAT